LFEGFFGAAGERETRELMARNLGPIAKTCLDMMTGRDLVRGTDIIDMIPDFALGLRKVGEAPPTLAEARRQLMSSGIGSLVDSYIGRGSRTWNAMMNIFIESKDPMSAMGLQARYAAHNALMGLEGIGYWMQDEEPTQKWLPAQIGGSIRKISPVQVRARRARDARFRMHDKTMSILSTEWLRVIPPHHFFMEEKE
jgi:hypothetical protein